MHTIYEVYGDKNVCAFVAYGKVADHKLYKDEKFKEELLATEVADAFKKGMLLISDGSNFLHPVKLAGNKVTTVDGTTAVTGTEWTAKAV